MRIHLRRSLMYCLLLTCGFLFLLSGLRSSQQLASLDSTFLHMAEVHQGAPHAIHQGTPHAVHQVTHRSDVSTLPVTASLWYPGADRWNDRILRQIQYVPDSYSLNGSDFRVIYVPGGLWDTPLGQTKFLEQQCLVDRCKLTTVTDLAPKADAVLIQNSLEDIPERSSPRQVWILWLLESPYNTISLHWLQNHINWTATYRADSTIVTPYEKFVPFQNGTGSRLARNYAAGKTELVAWFVSNCAAINQRQTWVRRLQKYVDVHIYGACGDRQCTRGPPGGHCDQLLNKKYKFYLSFENSNCEYYITEKLFWNALLNDIVPVVMGARKVDYLASAPPHSFIHVEEFPGVKSLAQYLLKLDRNDHLYNQYFKWKGSGSFINTKFWCRMCAMLHDVNKPHVRAGDVETWWRGNGTCTRDRWGVAEDVIQDWDRPHDQDYDGAS